MPRLLILLEKREKKNTVNKIYIRRLLILRVWCCLVHDLHVGLRLYSISKNSKIFWKRRICLWSQRTTGALLFYQMNVAYSKKMWKKEVNFTWANEAASYEVKPPTYLDQKFAAIRQTASCGTLEHKLPQFRNSTPLRISHNPLQIWGITNTDYFHCQQLTNS